MQGSDWSHTPVKVISAEANHQKQKSSCLQKPLQWWSAIPSLCQGLILGAAINCLVLAIILPIWLVKSSSTKTTTVATNGIVSLRWKSIGVTIAGNSGFPCVASDCLTVPWAVALDLSNSLYVTDRYNHRIQKFKSGAKNATTVAGQSNAAGGFTSNMLNGPTGFYVDSNGNIIISDTSNNRTQRWSNGALVGETLVGNGTSGIENNLLHFPYEIWQNEDSGAFFIADSFNHRIMRYAKNNRSGNVVAGGNGVGASSSQLSYPYGFYFDAVSNSLFITNAGTHNVVRWTIGAYNSTSVVGTIGISGQLAGLLRHPTDVILDPMGNIYVADMQNHRIQFFLSGQSDGQTIVGITGLTCTNASCLSQPASILLDNQLNLYVADQFNHRIQKYLRY